MLQLDLKVLMLLDDILKSFRNEITIEQVLTTLNKKMNVSGLGLRIIKDYNLCLKHFAI